MGCSGWAMSQEFPVNTFEWVKDAPQFNEDFIKNYNEEESNKRYILKLIFNILKSYMNFHNDLPFLPERMKTKKL